jgi:hypothetical protein
MERLDLERLQAAVSKTHVLSYHTMAMKDLNANSMRLCKEHQSLSMLA